MAKITRKQPDDLLKMFYENKYIQEFLNNEALQLKPLLMIGHKMVDGETVYSYLCPYCKEKFDDIYGISFCPHCKNIFKNKTVDFTVKWSMSSDDISIHSYRNELSGLFVFSETEVLGFNVTFYVDTSDIPDCKICCSIRSLGYFNEETNEKILYQNYTIDGFKLTTKRWSRVFYRYHLELFDPLNIYTERLGESAAINIILNEIDTFKVSPTKSISPKKKTSIPIPSVLKNPLPDVDIVDIKKIRTTLSCIDYMEGTETVKCECLTCGHNWSETRERGRSSTYICSECGSQDKTSQNTLTRLYVSFEEDMIICEQAEYRFFTSTESISKRRVQAFSVDNHKARIYDFCDGVPEVTKKRILDYGFIRPDEIIYRNEPEKEFTGIREFLNDGYKYNEMYYKVNTIFDFLKTVKQYPVLEKIAKADLGKEYERLSATGRVDLNADNIYDAFKISKAVLNKYKKENFDMDIFCMLISLYNNFKTEPIETLFYAARKRLTVPLLSSVLETVPHLSLSDIVSYIERVRITQMLQPEFAIREWRDYLRAAISIKMDMHDRRVLYPRALKTEHDIVVAKSRFISDQKTIEAFSIAVEKYKDLEYDKGNYFVKVPCSTEEMLEEGRKLHHCCGQYIDDVADETAFVLFLRKKSDPNIPFLSMEVLPTGEIRQVRGLNDSHISVLDEHREIYLFLSDFAKKKKLSLRLI